MIKAGKLSREALAERLSEQTSTGNKGRKFVRRLEQVDLARSVDTTSIDGLSGLIWTFTGDASVYEGDTGVPTYTVGYSGVTLAEGQTVSVDLNIDLPGGAGGAEPDEADACDDRAPENDFARTQAIQQEPDSGTDNAGLQLA